MADVEVEANVDAERVFYILDADGQIVDLTSMTVRVALSYGGVRITETATVSDATSGEVTHTFRLTGVGDYTLRFLVVNQGVVTRYPDGAPLTLRVWETI